MDTICFLNFSSEFNLLQNSSSSSTVLSGLLRTSSRPSATGPLFELTSSRNRRSISSWFSNVWSNFNRTLLWKTDTEFLGEHFNISVYIMYAKHLSLHISGWMVQGTIFRIFCESQSFTILPLCGSLDSGRRHIEVGDEGKCSYSFNKDGSYSDQSFFQTSQNFYQWNGKILKKSQ